MTRDRCPEHGRTRIAVDAGGVIATVCPDCARDDPRAKTSPLSVIS
jgi:hypothetical protein